jgi:O-antigen/teichoic acid export membrane protein
MTLKTGIFNNVFWRGLQILSTLVLNILVARYLGAAGSGSFFYLITIYTLFIQVGGLSLESALGFFTSNKKIPVTSLAVAAIAWSLIVTTTAIIVFLAWPNNEPVSNRSIANMSMFIAGNLLTNYFSSIFFAEMNFRIPNLYGTLINLVLTVLLTGFLFLNLYIDNPTIIQLFFCSFFLRGIIMVTSFYRNPEHQGRPGLITKSQAWMLFRYCGLAYVSNLLFFILYKIDYYFVEKYCSPTELGNYIQVCRIAQMLFLFPSMIATVVFPITCSKNNHYIRTQLPAISRVLFYTFLLVCGFVCLTGNWLFPFLFGADFNLMYRAFIWLIPGIIALSILYPFAAYYSGINQISMNIKGGLIALAVIITGDMLFIPFFGIQAAAAVSSVGYISYQLFIMIHFKNMHQTSSKEFFYFQAIDFHRISRSLKPTLVLNKK